jgi:hypothetical protein
LLVENANNPYSTKTKTLQLFGPSLNCTSPPETSIAEDCIKQRINIQKTNLDPEEEHPPSHIQ